MASAAETSGEVVFSGVRGRSSEETGGEILGGGEAASFVVGVLTTELVESSLAESSLGAGTTVFTESLE